MSEEILIEQCATTMAGLKTGSLFPCLGESTAQVMDSLRELNRRLVPKGLRLIPLSLKNGRALLYLYRPDRLKSDLCDQTAQSILKERSYPVQDPDRCVACLARRMKAETEFPHEVGLFLGYPPEDVDGFIRNKARGAKIAGPWKVYGDADAAKKRFRLYEKCAEVYGKAYRRGYGLDQLVVAEKTWPARCAAD